MKKELTYLKISFENCEAIKIGVKDIKTFRYDNEDEIILETIDNGDSEYISTWSENKISPLQRLTEYNNIVSIEVFYEDGQVENIIPEWHYENECNYVENNKYQINETIDYKHRKVTISKQQYIENRRNELNNIIIQAQNELALLNIA